MEQRVILTFLVLIVFTQALTFAVQASHGRRFLPNLLLLASPPYVTVTGNGTNSLTL